MQQAIALVAIAAATAIAAVLLAARLYHRDRPASVWMSATVGHWFSVAFHINGHADVDKATPVPLDAPDSD